MKPLFLIFGLLFLSLGFVGIFIPGLPTTPFVLLSAALFFRSSDKLYNRLISSRLFGKYIADFREKKGMTLRAKLISISIMWIMITLSILTIEPKILKLIIFIVGMIGTVVMGFCIKTSGAGRQ